MDRLRHTQILLYLLFFTLLYYTLHQKEAYPSKSLQMVRSSVPVHGIPPNSHLFRGSFLPRTSSVRGYCCRYPCYREHSHSQPAAEILQGQVSHLADLIVKVWSIVHKS